MHTSPPSDTFASSPDPDITYVFLVSTSNTLRDSRIRVYFDCFLLMTCSFTNLNPTEIKDELQGSTGKKVKLNTSKYTGLFPPSLFDDISQILITNK